MSTTTERLKEREVQADEVRMLAGNRVFRKLMAEVEEKFYTSKLKDAFEEDDRERRDEMREEIKGAHEVISYIKRRILNSTT